MHRDVIRATSSTSCCCCCCCCCHTATANSGSIFFWGFLYLRKFGKLGTGDLHSNKHHVLFICLEIVVIVRWFGCLSSFTYTGR